MKIKNYIVVICIMVSAVTGSILGNIAARLLLSI